MKRAFLYLATVCAVLACGCATEAEEDIIRSQKLELALSLDDAGTSRMEFADGRYAWEGSELLGVYVNSSMPTVNAGASVEVRDGVGYASLTTTGTFAEGDMLYAYHPYSRDNDSNTLRGVQLAIPDQQIQSEAGAFNLENMPMISDGATLVSGAQSQSVVMRPLGGFLCVNVYASGNYAGEKVKSILFDGGTTAAGGTFAVDMSAADALTISGHSMTELSVELETPCTVGTTLAAAESLYLVVAPASYTAKLTVVTDEARYNYTYNRTVGRNVYNTINIDLSKATDRTSLAPEPEPIVATLTYDEAQDAFSAYNDPKEYTNDYGTWTICAYNSGSAFQLNTDGSKRRYMVTPAFSGKITSIVLNHTENYTNDVYITATSTLNAAKVVTVAGGGSTTTIDLSGVELTQACITTAKYSRFDTITVTVNGSASGGGQQSGKPAFSNLGAVVTNASSATAADGKATVSATVSFNSSEGSVTNTGICWKKSGDAGFVTVDTGTSLAPSATLTGLTAGTYTFYVYAVVDNETRHESETFDFVVRDASAVVTPDYKYGWFELPVQKDDDNNGIDDDNSDYYYSHTMRADAAKIRNFSSCYSKSKLHPIWVAAPMHSSYLGSSGRNDSYKADPNIKCSQSPKFEGYTRGHMIGSSDRTISVATNKQAFYYSNIGAQTSSGFNTGGGAWNNLESLVDDQLCADTLYQVIGVAFQQWTDRYGKTISPRTSTNSVGTCQIPTLWYKVLLRTKNGNTGKRVDQCAASELKCVAFILGHYSNHQHKPSAQDMYSVEEVEQLTGLTFFPNVPNAPKSTYTASDWL